MIYLGLTLLTIAIGISMILSKRGDVNVVRSLFRWETESISGEPAIAFGILYLILGVVFLIDAISATRTGESKVSWIFFASWIGLGITYNLYVHNHQRE